MTFIFTCEHGGNHIPRQYAQLFRGHERLLQGHRGWDQGALQLARACARDCNAPLYFSEVSRLLIDLNRSPHHRALYSTPVRGLDAAAKQNIHDKYYLPYRQRVEAAILRSRRRPLLHLSFHSFTPELDGEIRHTDIGLLYDPARALEKEFCLLLKAALQASFPQLRIRRNYPYRGTADGFTTYLRTRFPARAYAGIELEINQGLVQANRHIWRRLLREMGPVLRGLSSRG